MSEVDFFRPEAREQAPEAVKAVEAQTSAEVVVAVRRQSGDTRASAYHFGLIAAGVVEAYLLIAPRVFSVGAMALDGLAAFLLATLVGANVAALRRALVRRTTLRDHAARGARVAFYDLGISRTSGRNGILVFVSTFERCCVVLPDVGIDVAALGPGWSDACDRLDRAVRQGRLPDFFQALRGLGPVLGKAMPRAEDDVNELPDEVQ